MTRIERPWMKPISLGVEEPEGTRDNYVLPCRGLKLIGIRFYPYPGHDRIQERKVRCIQKNLYGSPDWFYFNKGFSITENEPDNPNAISIDVEEGAFDSTFLLYSDELKMNIGVSAIIGQNGTGKSTIVDTVVRLVNNLAAAIIGEGYVYSSAQHLHYIDNVYASLAVYMDTKVRILTCKGGVLYVSTYETDLRQLAEEDVKVERYHHTITTDVLTGNEPKNQLLPPQNGLRYVLKEWFYTMVGNYSLYAYNYRDYSEERTSDAKLSLLRKIRPEDNKEEDEYWLKGVFHKNDGYQTPVVIHPMRNKGYVNAAQVNYLGKQNLIALAFEENAHPERGGGKFPFRIINKTHHLVAFYFYPPDANEYNGFIDGIMKVKFDLTDAQKKLFGELEKTIKDFWAKAIGANNTCSPMDRAERRAWDYVAYKTIKIFWNYKHYETAWENLEGECDLNKFEEHLKTILKDSSHRTQKLRQALAFLRFRGEKDYLMNKGAVVDLDDIYAWMSQKVGGQLYPGQDYHKITIDDLLPPPYPIADVVLQLVDNEHLEEYKAIKNKSLNIIPFAGLSAGERQIAYTLGNIVYHLKNIESAKQDLNIDTHHLESLKYDYVNVMLDEVELYFHPDLQRRFVSLFLDAIKGLNLDGMSGINVTLITHSPFVLSDIPSENIMFLSRNEDDVMQGNTFAANIHDLFNNTFFLPYTVGELARKEISEIVGLYQIWRSNRSGGDRHESENRRWLVSNQELEGMTQRKWAKMKYIAGVVGDEYLQGEITDMLEEMGELTERRQHDEES